MLLNYKYIELCFEITETDLLQKKMQLRLFQLL